MAKVEFKTFKEASEFTKQISAETKSCSPPIHKDGDFWWVDDPRNQKPIVQKPKEDDIDF